MTEDYKKNLIDYVTGQLNIESGTQKDINIVDTKYIKYDDNTSLWNDIRTELSNIGTAFINGVLQNDNYDVSIAYGTIYINSTTEDRGFLIYLDSNLTPIKLLLKYNTNNDLKGFHKLYYDEETNRCYGVIGSCFNSNTSSTFANRFAFFNNLFYKGTDYEVDLRTSYDISDNNFKCMEIVKDPEGANYLMMGCNPANYITSRAIELKINVDSQNEWKRWTSSGTGSTNIFIGCYASYSSNNPSFKIFTFNNSTKYLGVLYNTGDTLNKTDYLDIRVNNVTTINYIQRPLQYEYINANEIYFTLPATWQIAEGGIVISGRLALLYKYDGSSITELYRTDFAGGDSTYQLNIIKDTDNTLFLLKYYSNNITNNTNLKVCNLTNHIGGIVENDWINIGSFSYLDQTSTRNQTTFLIRKYNIAQICSLNSFVYSSTATIGYEIILKNLSAINGYNGDAYTGVNSLCPLLSNLYSNGSLEFSRNLYNISKQGNTTTSSVEIPNNFLNSISITQNDLISSTNLEMNNNTNSWNKNIYEVVDLNFLNTISVIDKDKGTQYMNSAIKVNNAITDGGNTNYQNTPCNKYRINYVDSTSAINDLTWSSIDDLHKQTSISLSVSKEINSIDFISHDESTIYLTIPLNVEVGKNYTISQKIRIGE